METNKLYKSSAYWTQMIQIMIYDAISNYLVKNKMTQKEFADKLGVSKGYVSQIMNGDFDHRLSKLCELLTACDLVPKFETVPVDYASEVVKSYQKPSDWKSTGSIFEAKLPYGSMWENPANPKIA